MASEALLGVPVLCSFRVISLFRTSQCLVLCLDGPDVFLGAATPGPGLGEPGHRTLGLQLPPWLECLRGVHLQSAATAPGSHGCPHLRHVGGLSGTFHLRRLGAVPYSKVRSGSSPTRTPFPDPGVHWHRVVRQEEGTPHPPGNCKWWRRFRQLCDMKGGTASSRQRCQPGGRPVWEEGPRSWGEEVHAGLSPPAFPPASGPFGVSRCPPQAVLGPLAIWGAVTIVCYFPI